MDQRPSSLVDHSEREREDARRRIMTCAHVDCRQRINVTLGPRGKIAVCSYGHRYDPAILEQKLAQLG